MSRYYSVSSFFKITKNGPRPDPGSDGGATAKTTPHRTTNWPDPPKGGGSDYNRATKAHVVSTTAKKRGLP